MARASAEKVGPGICPQVACGAPVWYRRSTGGLLSHKCDSCDSSGFAEPGGKAFAERMATIKAPKAAEAAPGAGTDPKPAPTQAVKKSGFSLESLQ